jgi:hypothetical protein
MSSEFGINEVAFGDAAGMGAYEVGHYRQHLDYQTVLAARTPPVILPVFPIFHFGGNAEELKFWLNDHEALHELLRPLANVQSVDLSSLDWNNPQLFYVWQDTHKAEHLLLDQAFGVQ